MLTIASILAVASCLVDIATQGIITLAAEADPGGKRTLGVLTKPDLLIENATKEAIADLVRGRRRDLALGYYVVLNRSADDKSFDLKNRQRAEEALFSTEPWSKLNKSRLGIPALHARLRDLLMDRTKSEFPKVKRELAERHKEAKKELDAMGPARSTPDQQRACLGAVATRYMELRNFGLDAYYTGDRIFTEQQDLRLITRIRALNDAFAELFFEKGHSREFLVDDAAAEPARKDLPGEVGESVSDMTGTTNSVTFTIPPDDLGELDGILVDEFVCSEPDDEGIMEHIIDIYLNSRGYEIGTVCYHLTLALAWP